MKNKYLYRLSALSLATLLLAVNTYPAPVLAASKEKSQTTTSSNSKLEALNSEDSIHISSIADFEALAKNCVLDTWSRDKIVVLDNDLDFENTHFTSIPTFGGKFYGQGHTIKGLSLSGGDDYLALFRYLQTSGEIHNLNVAGVGETKTSQLGLSLLVGQNSGYITSCHATGSLKGGDNVGLLTGYNTMDGVIDTCLSDGSVNGSHRVGGIAGLNEGNIVSSTNRSQVGTVVSDNNIDLSLLTVDDLLSTEAITTVTDIGGISGRNTGIIRACVNNGAVGYQHVGYNIGGIAGSQVGYIEGCINYGVLNGRKDVGGIAGQMEPVSEIEYLEDTLNKLNTEFNTLHTLVSKMDQDAKGTSSKLTGQTGELLNSVEGVQSVIDGMLSSSSDQLNEFSLKLTDLSALPSPNYISLEFLDDLENRAMDAIPSITPTPDSSTTPESSAAPIPVGTPTPTQTPVSGSSRKVFPLLPNEVPGELPGEIITSGSYELPVLAAGRSALLHTGRLLSAYDDPVSTPTPTPSATPSATPFIVLPSIDPGSISIPSVNPEELANVISSAIPQVDREDVEETINDAQQDLYDDANSLIDSMKNTLRDEVSSLSLRMGAHREALSSSVSGVISNTRTLNTMLDGEDQLLLDDFQAITNQVNVIENLITDPDVPDADDLIQDVSDEDTDTTITGKVRNCQNKAAVNGDLNVGGVAGSMSRENDLDPEDDLNINDASSLNIKYNERIVVRDCTNSGEVTGKKNCVGGIAGYMALGSIFDCIGNGDVTSEGGDMVGGIAGFSDASIRKSSAKCALSGENQIGGIVGSGKTITDCYSMVMITDGTDFLGSIAGKADLGEEISGNYYVADCPPGIDGISYSGIAEPLAYGEFLTLKDSPDVYQTITLTFVADDRLVTTIRLSYGEKLDPTKLPSVPAKTGYSGRWEDFDYSPTYDRTIHAVYSEYLTALESDQKDDRDRPIVLLEGSFEEGNRFIMTDIDAYKEAVSAEAECKKISILGGSGPYKVHYLLPESIKNPSLELYQDGSFVPVEGSMDGSYYVFETDQQEFIFSCTDRPASRLPIIIACLAGVLCILLLLLVFVHKAGKNKADKDKQDKAS